MADCHLYSASGAFSKLVCEVAGKSFWKLPKTERAWQLPQPYLNTPKIKPNSRGALQGHQASKENKLN